MVEAVVFAGPSLPAVQLKGNWIRVRPAGRGDILRALLTHRPRAIGLIDGWICDRPSVGHKEILLALSEGVKVFGASGIGAIRAAELRTFGMVGVGKVYNAYAEGLIDADDEVAVATTDGKEMLSVALVDVRATLQSAVAKGILERELGFRLLAAAKRLHYTERTYARIVDAIPRDTESAVALDALSRWLSYGTRSSKMEDAHCLLDALADGIREPAAPREFARPMETPAWCQLYARISAEIHEQSTSDFE
jgi:hypothetical protein